MSGNATVSPGFLLPPGATFGVNGTNSSPPVPPPPPPPPPLLQPPIADVIIGGRSNVVTDDALRSAIIIDVVIGVICFLAFIIFQSRSVLYKIRLVSQSVTTKPPPLPQGVSSLWSWLVSTLITSDQEMLQSCGLDAFMHVKMLTYGVQLFTPIAFFGLVMFLPIHMSSNFLASDVTFGNQANFMKTTMTNVPSGDPVLWLHCVFVLFYIGWGCWLLKWHFQQFVTIRQHWLRTGDKPNLWRPLYDAKEDDSMSVRAAWSTIITKAKDAATDAARMLNPLGPSTAQNPDTDTNAHAIPASPGGSSITLANAASGPTITGSSADTLDGVPHRRDTKSQDGGGGEGRERLSQLRVRVTDNGRVETDPGIAVTAGSVADLVTPGSVRTVEQTKRLLSMRRRASINPRAAAAAAAARSALAVPPTPCTTRGAGPMSLSRLSQLANSREPSATGGRSANPPRTPASITRPTNALRSSAQFNRSSLGPLAQGAADTTQVPPVSAAALSNILHEELGLRPTRKSGSGAAAPAAGAAGAGGEAASGPGSNSGVTAITPKGVLTAMVGGVVGGGRALAKHLTFAPRRLTGEAIHEDTAEEHAAAQSSDGGTSRSISRHLSLIPSRSSTMGREGDRQSAPTGSESVQVVVHDAGLGEVGAALASRGSGRASPPRPPTLTIPSVKASASVQARTPAAPQAAAAAAPASTQPRTPSASQAAAPSSSTGAHTPPLPPLMPSLPNSTGTKASLGPKSPLARGASETGATPTKSGPSGSFRGVAQSMGAGLNSFREASASLGAGITMCWSGGVEAGPNDTGPHVHRSVSQGQAGPSGSTSTPQKVGKHRRAVSAAVPELGSGGGSSVQRSGSQGGVGVATPPNKTRSPHHKHAKTDGTTGSARRREHAQDIIQSLTIPVQDSELPVWWADTKTKYDAQAAKAQAVASSRHSRKHTHGQDSPGGSEHLHRRLSSSARAQSAGGLTAQDSTRSIGGTSTPGNGFARVSNPLYQGQLQRTSMSVSNTATPTRSASGHRRSKSAGAPNLDAWALSHPPDGIHHTRLPPLPQSQSFHARPSFATAPHEAPAALGPLGVGATGALPVRSASRNTVGSQSAGGDDPGDAAVSESNLTYDVPESEVLFRPSVSHMKTINTVNKRNEIVAVQAQQYAVLVTDVNQNLWTGEKLWHFERDRVTHAILSALIPKALRGWVMANYAVQALDLYDDMYEDLDPLPSLTSHNLDTDLTQTQPQQQDAQSQPEAAAGSHTDAAAAQPAAGGHETVGATVHAAAAGAASPTAAAATAAGQAVAAGHNPAATSLAAAAAAAVAAVDAEHAAERAAAAQHGASTAHTAGHDHHHTHSTPHNTNPDTNPVQPLTSQGRLSLSRGKSVSSRGPGPVAEAAGDTTANSSNGLYSTELTNRTSRTNGRVAHGDVTAVEHVAISIAAGNGDAPAGNGPDSNRGTGSSAGRAGAMLTKQQSETGVRKSEIGVERKSEGGTGDNLEKTEAEKAEAKKRALDRWALVRGCVKEGLIQQMPYDPHHYSLVTATFKRLFPDDYLRAIPVFNHKKTDMLLFKLDQLTNAYMQAEFFSRLRGRPPLGRLKMFGPKVDLLEHYTQEIAKVNGEVKEARREAIESGFTPSWLVFFKTQMAAAMCSQSVIHAEDNREFKVSPAPGPEEVNWPALWMNYRQRDLRSRYIVQPLLIILVLIPIGIFTGGIQQLEFIFCPLVECRYDNNPQIVVYERGYCPDNTTMSASDAQSKIMWEWYCKRENPIARFLATAVTGWLPSLLLMLWQNMVLPLAMLFLAQAGGRCYSYSMMDQMIAANIFWFNLFQSFIGGILGSALVQQISSLFSQGPGEALRILGTFLPSSSNFFVAYMLLRTLALQPLKLLTPHIGIRMYLFRRYFFRCSIAPLTPREEAFFFANTSPRIGFEYGMALLMFLIPMTFGVLAPVLPVIGLGFFMITWTVWRYLYLYIFIRKYESGGLMFRFVYNRMLIVFGVFGLFTACVFISKQAFAQAIVLFVLVPIILYNFHNYIYYRFLEALSHTPLTLASHAPAAPPAHVHHGKLVGIASSYIPPPLTPGSVGWHPEWNKPWMGWQLPTAYCVT